MLSGWIWICIVVVCLLACLGLASGNAADKSGGSISKEYRRESHGSFGCGFALIFTVILLMWALMGK